MVRAASRCSWLTFTALTGDARYRVAATKGLDFDLSKSIATEHGQLWPRHEGDNHVRTYWIEGAAGIGSVAIRLHTLLGLERYRTEALQIAADAFVKHTVSPGLFYGLSGIAEFMLDVFTATGDEVYWTYAADMADTVLWYRLDRQEGVAWPGRWLTHVANDYATGGAGIGLFLLRLIATASRARADLPRKPVDLAPAPTGLDMASVIGPVSD